LKGDKVTTEENSYWRVYSFLVENFMGLRHVEFKPTGRMTVFTGRNGQGKTSALVALMYGLAGKAWSPEMPTRRGAAHFKIELGLINDEKGTLIVKRTPSGLKVEPGPGCKAWTTPQAMLDSIYQELTLDPLEFIRMGKDAEGKRRQVELLRSAITLDVDLDELARLNEMDFNARRLVNRDVERLKAEIAAIPVQPGLPDQPVDVAEIQERIRAANEHNRTIVQQIEARQRLAAARAEAEAAEKRNAELIAATHRKIEVMTADIAEREPAGAIAGAIRDTLEDLRDKASRLPGAARLAEDLSNARARAINYVGTITGEFTAIRSDLEQARKVITAAEKQQQQLSQAVADAQQALEQAPQPVMLDAAAIVEELTHAQMVNREIEKRDRQNALKVEYEEKAAKARALTRAMETREEEKNRAVANAKMPIEGLTFTVEAGREEILFNNVPISQLGEAQQIRISISIALARKPKLRIVRIPHGEALDDESMAALAEMAEEMDFYVWMAKVDSSGQMGIYLEDGEIKAVNEASKISKKEEIT
jgi:hypothetical protein